MSSKLQYQQLVKAGALGRLPFIEIDSLGVEKARVVFQGMEGAYGQGSYEDLFRRGMQQLFRPYIPGCNGSNRGGAPTDYAVLPIENSTAGAVNEVYDLLVEFENYIVGEVIIPITHTLAGLPGTQLSELKRVYSKAEALMQTTRFLEEHSGWQQISVANTAIAAKKILDDQDRTLGGSLQCLCGKSLRTGSVRRQH